MDLKQLEDNLYTWQSALERRGAEVDLNKVLEAHKCYLELLQKSEELRARRNTAARAQDIEAGKPYSAEATKGLRQAKGLLKEMEDELATAKAELDELVAGIPNLPSCDIPDGGEENNKVLGVVGKPRTIDNPKDHIELGEGLGILDIERGTKVSGARFYYLKNQAVELEFAIVRWLMDLLKEKGFELLIGPELLNEKAMLAGGYLGKAVDEVYKTQDELYLIGTAEQSILAYHLDEIVPVPKRYASFSTCFRREAGSYGKDVKGIIRTHQFDKIEMFSFVAPSMSAREHEFLVSIQEEILQGLEIPYQKVLLAAGDLSMASAKTIDLESWLPSQNRHRETHSCSNCTDWQGGGGKIRYREQGSPSQLRQGFDGQAVPRDNIKNDFLTNGGGTTGNKPELVHTLNGTAVAIGRILVAILENHQQIDGSVIVPKVLHPYLSFKEIRP